MPPPKVWPDDTKAWTLTSKYGPPDLVVKSPDYTMPAVAQDAWWRPTVPTGLTEPRWVRAIEIHSSSVKARKITHHALAFLQQTEKDMPKELVTNDPNVAGAGLFMEWAVGKYGDEMRPGSGRLMLPGSNITFYADDVAPLLPKGTILHFIAWYDNTKANKSNPDPDQWVGWGDPFNPNVDKDNGGRSSAVATFTTPGEYILRLQATDSSGEGGGGFQCCWTTAHVRVDVKPSTTR